MDQQKRGRFLYLMYEIDQRELASRLHVGEAFAHAGWTVVIFRHSHLSQITMHGAPGVLVLKSLSSSFVPYLQCAKSRGFYILGSQEEALAISATTDSLSTFDPRCSPLLDGYLAWTSEDAALATRLGVPASRVHVVGSARLDLSRSLRQAHSKQTAGIEFQSSEKVLLALLPQTETRSEPGPPCAGFFVKFLRALLHRKKEAPSLPEYESWLEQSKLGSHVMFQLLDVIQSRVDVTLVVRPYPLDPEPNFDAFSGEATIWRSGNVLEAAEWADYVIHFGSSAGKEFEGLANHVLDVAAIYDNCAPSDPDVPQWAHDVVQQLLNGHLSGNGGIKDLVDTTSHSQEESNTYVEGVLQLLPSPFEGPTQKSLQVFRIRCALARILTPINTFRTRVHRLRNRRTPKSWLTSAEIYVNRPKPKSKEPSPETLNEFCLLPLPDDLLKSCNVMYFSYGYQLTAIPALDQP